MSPGCDDGADELESFGVTDVMATLRLQYPHGHPDFIPSLIKIMRLHSDKNHDYASGGRPLGNFERTAKIMQLYPTFPWATNYGCATVHMLKQIDAFLWQVQTPEFRPKVEGAETRLRDIAVFSQLIAIMLQERGNEGPSRTVTEEAHDGDQR